MAAEPQRTVNWNALEGKILEGGYEIQDCLEVEPQSAIYKVRILGDRFTNAVATVFAPGTVPPDQGAIWQEMAELRHPHLNLPLSLGSIPFDGGLGFYLITIAPDETLEGVLKERALSPEEAEGVASAAVEALEYLHENGLVHTALSPAEVLAIGDSVRLSTLRVRRGNAPLPTAPFPPARYKAPESSTTGNISRAADVYCLGATILEVLTRKPADSAGDARIKTLPAPFNAFVECALNPDPAARCHLNEVRSILAGRIPDRLRPAPATPPSPEPVAETRPEPGANVSPVVLDAPVPTANTAVPADAGRTAKAEPSASNAPVAARTAASTQPELIRTVPHPPRPRSDRPPYTPASRPPRPAAQNAMEGKRLWIYGGAIIALIILAILFARDHHPAKAPVQGPATAAWPAHEVGPETAKAPAASRPAPVAAVQPKPAVPNAAANWRVIAYTFNREADAIKRVNAIKQTHPSLLPEVFQPSGHGPYLVSLGGELTKEEAERVRQRARADGMPRDTFVRNYK